MKKLIFSLAIFAVTCLNVAAQLSYYDASKFQIIGRPDVVSAKAYVRLPDALKGQVRDELWNLGQNTAGIAIRFRSNATEIGAKWRNTSVFNMNHMTPTGIRGLDLYCLQDDGTWRFVNSARPAEKISNKYSIMKNMVCKDREYMLYLPLYNGIDSLEIGVNESAYITMPKANTPRVEKPIVWYGTSITQGGCATRPGMAGTNILERILDRVVINMGFSGNGKLDPEVAEVMAEIDASIYLLDMLPNVTTPMLKDNIEKFYQILRKAHPTTPILLCENPEFPNMHFNVDVDTTITIKNKVLKDYAEKFRKAGDKNVYFIPSKGQIGNDAESTVDCYHLTDLGFLRSAEYFAPIIRKYIKK